MVSLNVPDQDALISLAAKLKARAIPHILFYEPDITAYTALCTTDAGAELMRNMPLALRPVRSKGKNAVSKTDNAGSIPAQGTNQQKQFV